MSKAAVRKMVSCVLVILFPMSLFAADSNAAMLYTHGAAWVNGAFVPRSSSAIFSGDLLQTRSDSVANINRNGSTITVQADSLVQYLGGSVEIDHGGVLVATSSRTAAVAGDVKVTPAGNSWTEFNVVDTDGTVHIAARKGDVTVTDGSETVTLQQGQETTRDEQSSDNSDQNSGKKSKRNKKRYAGASAAGGGGILNSPYAIAAGGAAAIGVTTWVLIKSDNPTSPSKP